MKLLKLIEFDKVSQEEIDQYEYRLAARGVVFDDDNKIAILDVQNRRYHKLPGGGKEGDESVIQAFKRECREEIGCEIDVLVELGKITEHRTKWKIRQDSICYTAKLVGNKGSNSLTPDEIAKGFKVIWVDLDEGIKLLESDNSDDYQAKFVKERDLMILRLAKEMK